MNHKRRKPKHKRGGCLFCKWYKDEGEPKSAKPSDARRMQTSKDWE